MSSLVDLITVLILFATLGYLLGYLLGYRSGRDHERTARTVWLSSRVSVRYTREDLARLCDLFDMIPQPKGVEKLNQEGH